jgi:outer membrane protein assembly factor BamB
MASTKGGAAAGLIHVGIKGRVVALDRATGDITWSTTLKKGSSFVVMAIEGDRLFALSGGEITCLDAATGQELWHNPLKGFGTGYALFAADGPGSATSAIAAAQAAAAAAAASAASASASAAGT